MKSSDVKYFVSVNSMQLDGKLPDGDPRWSQFTNSFEKLQLSPIQLLDAIQSGRAYCPWVDGGRKKENFELAQHIGIDFDTEDERSSIDELMEIPLIRAYASIIHTTPSHTPDAPRARVLFLLDEPVLDVAKYESMLRFMIAVTDSDPSCSDATRFFYGNKNAEIAFPAHELPVAHLRELYRRYSANMQQQPIAGTQVEPQNGVIRLADYRERKQHSESNAASIIEAFNANNRIEHILATYGYTKCNNRTWSRPGKHESAGVYINHQDNKTYNHSSNDPLFAGRNGSKQPADPFDYYCHFEHGGDIKSALKSLESPSKVVRQA